jgi:hypothetical protein
VAALLQGLGGGFHAEEHARLRDGDDLVPGVDGGDFDWLGVADTRVVDEIYPTGGDPPVLDVVRVADGYRAGICLLVPETGAAP